VDAGVHRIALLGDYSVLMFSLTSSCKGEITGVEAGRLFLLGMLCSAAASALGWASAIGGWARGEWSPSMSSTQALQPREQHREAR
jgi:hypothetical protein